MFHDSFATTNQVALLNQDNELSLQRFREKGALLFSSDRDDFEVLQLRKWDEEIQFNTCRIQNSESLGVVLTNDAFTPSESFYIFHQLHSWDRLCVTQRTVQRILAVHETFSALLDLFCAFGFKTREDDNSWNHFRQLIADHSINELCYSIRYIEKNGRGIGDPWSLRQTGVYQKTGMQTERSTWIFLQPSESIRRRLQKSLKSLAEHSTPSADPFRYHVLILTSSLCNWNEYIMDLYHEVDYLNDKACFSRVGFKKKHDFTLTFSDCQKLRLIEQRILQAASALDSYIDTCTRCMAFCRLRYGSSDHPPPCAICIELASCLAEAESYRRKITNLLRHSSSTATLLLKILEYRNDEAIQESGIARRTTLNVMKDVAIETKKENESLTKLAAQTVKDSKMLKALTLIATIYLPATFLATIFSSNLVQRSDGHDRTDTHLVLVDDFWKYVVIIIPLMAFTFALTAFLEWIWSKTSPVSQDQSPV